MRIDVPSRKTKAAAGAAAFVALVAWLVPPTKPQAQPSPLLAFAGVESHRDDAARNGSVRSTAYSAAAWKRWYAGQRAVPAPAPVPQPRAVAPARQPAMRRAPAGIAADRAWDEAEDDRRYWAERRREDDRLWRESQREAERRWSRDDDEDWAAEAEDRAYERQRAFEPRLRRYPEEDPYYEGEPQD